MPIRTLLRRMTFSFRKYWSISGFCFSDENQKTFIYRISFLDMIGTEPFCFVGGKCSSLTRKTWRGISVSFSRYILYANPCDIRTIEWGPILDVICIL